MGDGTTRSVGRTWLKVWILGVIGVYSHRDSPMVLIVYAAFAPSLELAIDPKEFKGAQILTSNNMPSLAFSRDRQIVRDWLICKWFDVWGTNN